MRIRDDAHTPDGVTSVNLDKLSPELARAVREVLDPLGLIERPGGYLLEPPEHDGKRLKVMSEGRRIHITAPTRVGYLRGLSHLQHVLDTGTIIEEEEQFESVGIMLDLSRNGVLTVASIQTFLRYAAVMGLNQLLLYIEDTYEVEGYPYFGHLRGAYTREELEAIDAYAAILGIEVVPCIQTLGHLATTLRWPHAQGIMDTPDILMVGEEGTYKLVEAMIRAASAPFRSGKIHLGMDEAHALGLGRYLDKHGYRNRFEIMEEHLERVLEITRSLDLEPMIWSDMYFRLAHGGAYYPAEDSEGIPEEVKSRVPKDVDLVYWDYYHHETKDYERMLDRHHELTPRTVFAGGIWTWNGLKPNHGKMFETTAPALEACRKNGVREIFATAWGDNGQETFLIEGLLGMQLYGEYAWREDTPSRVSVLDRLEACTSVNADALYALRLFDELPRVEKDNPASQIVSKQILYNDPLVGVLDRHLTMGGHEAVNHYKKLAAYFDRVSEDTSAVLRGTFLQSAQLADVLARKLDLTLSLRQAYLLDDKRKLLTLTTEAIPELIAALEDYRAFTLALWYLYNKPFGSEVLDIRIGAQITRLKTCQDRVGGYLLGNYPELPELEAQRLSVDGRDDASLATRPYTPDNRWQRIATANPL